ncbi:hypothetical protein CALCODRAFT_517102 [Calocera cornea HHB12733]|uniref:Microbial-type PARG catalytic domain-containing protein n=1 Tax=Calocera cornea HHB12733 TaxID=1353952 RepID=A0A165GGI0_9BASI|nr:hypothetical protein CALCODRAFT_517102 [Calocera cornea HHB12733]
MTVSLRRWLAGDTLRILLEGVISVPLAPSAGASAGVPPCQYYNIIRNIQYAVRNTEFLDVDEPHLKNWRSALADLKREHALNGGFLQGRRSSSTRFSCINRTTLEAARHMQEQYGSHLGSAGVGVLNCGNPTQPGGGFVSGQWGEEESLVMSSTLYESLLSPQASQFYAQHKAVWTDGEYTDAMIYSPGVVVFRNDTGQPIVPYSVNIVTAAAHNLAELRQALDDDTMEQLEELGLAERMARILWVFLSRGCRTLVLGAFGAGACQNSVTVLAKIWAELLCCSNSPFATTFDHIEFALADVAEFGEFKAAFEAMLGKSWSSSFPTYQTPSYSGYPRSTSGFHPGVTSSYAPPSINHTEARRLTAENTITVILEGSVRVPLAPSRDGGPHWQDYQVGHTIPFLLRDTEFLDIDEPYAKNWKLGLADLKRRHEQRGGFLRTRPTTTFACTNRTILHAARSLREPWGVPALEGHVGVLNCGNPTEPGGGFLFGEDGQEESLARSSTLYSSLRSKQASQFYAQHKTDGGDGEYTRALIYSPGVLVFRDDTGQPIVPYPVNVVTASAVNLAEVKQVVDDEVVEEIVADEMAERMARILWVFLSRGSRHLVLGAFGAGACQNSPGTIARTWAELLAFPASPYFATFERVEFAVPQQAEFDEFRAAWGAKLSRPLSEYTRQEQRVPRAPGGVY